MIQLATLVFPGAIVLYSPTAGDVIASGMPRASEDELYPMIVSSVNWKVDANGQHSEPGYDSVNGTAFIDGKALAVHNVSEGSAQGTFRAGNLTAEPPVVAPVSGEDESAGNRGAPMVAANPDIPLNGGSNNGAGSSGDSSSVSGDI